MSSFFSLENGGAPPKFVIIDDGWQSVDMDTSGVGYEADNAAKWALSPEYSHVYVVSLWWWFSYNFR